MSAFYGVIGGSGLYELGEDFRIDSAQKMETPYGVISAEMQVGDWHGHRLAFLPRHGADHGIPPHRINYRANLWALHSLGVSHVIAANAVGGISARYAPEVLGVPDQIIDYTCNRDHSFFDGANGEVVHVEFSRPYSEALRRQILAAGEDSGIELVDGGTYGCTNGPRLETAAEIARMKSEGCSIVGMTGMPEAALARELSIDYASIALVVNWAAGIEDGEISMDEIRRALTRGVGSIRRLVAATLARDGS